MNAPEDTTGLARMMDLASTMLLEVCDAIAATPLEDHTRFEMLQLKATTGLALATLAQTTVAMLDVGDDEGDEGEPICGAEGTDGLVCCLDQHDSSVQHVALDAVGKEIGRW